MISTVTTSTVTTVTTTGTLIASLVSLVVVFLIALLTVKELASSTEKPVFKKLGGLLNVGIAPLLVVFAAVVITEVIGIIR